MDQRFDFKNGGPVGILEWLMGLTPNVNLVTYEARNVLETVPVTCCSFIF